MKDISIKRLLILFSLTILFTIIILFVENKYSEYLKKERQEEKEIMQKIEKDYKSFNIKANKMTEEREKFYKAVSNSLMYYESMKKEYTNIINNIKSYENVLNDIDTSSKFLLNNCINKEYSSSDIVKKCYIFANNYEQITNYFVTDINIINNKIIEYNSWVKENNLGSEKLEKYALKHNKYVDINKDKKYLGKEAD